MRTRFAVGPVLVLVLSALTEAGQAPPAQKVPPALAKGRLDAARKTYEMLWIRHRNATAMDPEKLYVWSRRWMEAQQTLNTDKDKQMEAVQAHLDRMKKVEEFFMRLVKTGQGSSTDHTAAEYYRIEAEIWLAQAKDR